MQWLSVPHLWLHLCRREPRHRGVRCGQTPLLSRVVGGHGRVPRDTHVHTEPLSSGTGPPSYFCLTRRPWSLPWVRSVMAVAGLGAGEADHPRPGFHSPCPEPPALVNAPAAGGRVPWVSLIFAESQGTEWLWGQEGGTQDMARARCLPPAALPAVVVGGPEPAPTCTAAPLCASSGAL